MGCWLEGTHTCSKCCTVHICMMHAPAYTIVSSLCPLHSHQLVRTELERLGSVWCWLADLKLCSWIRGIGSFISTQEICFAAGNWRLHCYGLDEHWREELSLGPGSYACLSVAVDTVKPDVNLSTCQLVNLSGHSWSHRWRLPDSGPRRELLRPRNDESVWSDIKLVEN